MNKQLNVNDSKLPALLTSMSIPPGYSWSTPEQRDSTWQDKSHCR